MHADFSRVTFQPAKHYSAVLAQQGRVQLDADSNEQAAIELHRIRTLTRDLIGRHGGPADGFMIEHVMGDHEADLKINGGRYYVDGILCDADRPQPALVVSPDGTAHAQAGADTTLPYWTYWEQPDAYRDPERQSDRLPGFPYLVYLKVFERSVSAVEDPSIREVALGTAMPDTAARLKTVWQVLLMSGTDLNPPDGGVGTIRDTFRKWVAAHTAPSSALAARTERPDRADEEPCLVRPASEYRGPENQLYRVEIHHGGPASEGATFKWSRENGSVVFPVAAVEGTWVDLTTLGNDDKLSLDVGDWVEFGDTAYVSRGEVAPLLQVEEIDLPGRRVRLSGEPVPGVGRQPKLHPFLRRWDHNATTGHGAPQIAGGALQITEGRWVDLEDGLQVWFKPGGEYRSGDYWIIPARTVTGTVEWPQDAAGDPLLRQPAGIQVHYAPLAWVMGENTIEDLRQVFTSLIPPDQAARES